MRCVAVFGFAALVLSGCGEASSDRGASEGGEPVQSAASEKFVWKDREVRLREGDFAGRKISFVSHHENLAYDPYYQSGNYPTYVEFNFYKGGRVHKYYHGYGSDTATQLQWEIEGDTLYVNDGNRRLGSAMKEPLAIEFNAKPADEVVVKWKEGIRGTTSFARIHEFEAIPASEQIDPDFRLRAASIAGKSITFSISGGDDGSNPTYHFERNGRGSRDLPYKGSADINWRVEGKDLAVDVEGSVYTYTFERVPTVGDEISRNLTYPTSSGTGTADMRVFVYSIE